MSKNSKNTEIIRNNSELPPVKTPDLTFSFKDLNAGAHVPSHLFLFELLEKNEITASSFSVFMVIFKVAFFERQGLLEFPLSNPEIRKRTGLGRYQVVNALQNLQDQKLIKCTIGKNGLATTVKINVTQLRKLNKKDPANNEQGDHAKKEQGEGVDPAKKEQGTMLKSSTHLYNKLLKVSSSHENKFYDSKKRNIFKTDLERLVNEGFNIDAIASFLETRISDFDRIQSFYGVIKSQKDSLSQIHEDFQNLKTKNELAERQRIDGLRAANQDEVSFKTPSSMTNWKKPKTLLKGESGPKDFMHNVGFQNSENNFTEH